MKRLLTVLLCVLALTLSVSAQARKSSMKKSAAGPAPDKALMQKVWDGWGTMDPANVAKFYATGPRTFFDIAPLKERPRRLQECEVHREQRCRDPSPWRPGLGDGDDQERDDD